MALDVNFPIGDVLAGDVMVKVATGGGKAIIEIVPVEKNIMDKDLSISVVCDSPDHVDCARVLGSETGQDSVVANEILVQDGVAFIYEDDSPSTNYYLCVRKMVRDVPLNVIALAGPIPHYQNLIMNLEKAY